MNKVSRSVVSGFIGVSVAGGALLMSARPHISDEAIEACAESLQPPVETFTDRAPEQCYGPTIRAIEFIGAVAIIPTPEEFRIRAQEEQNEDRQRDILNAFLSLGFGLGATGLAYTRLGDEFRAPKAQAERQT